MDTEKNMVTVPLERYEQLIATEARMRVLTVFTQPANKKSRLK